MVIFAFSCILRLLLSMLLVLEPKILICIYIIHTYIYTYLMPNTFPVIVIEMFFERATAGKNEASIVPDIPDTTEQRHVFRKHSVRDTRDLIFSCLGKEIKIDLHLSRNSRY